MNWGPVNSDPSVHDSGAGRAARPWWQVARRRFSLIGFALCALLLVWLGLQVLIAALLRMQGVNIGAMPTWLQLIAGNGPLYALAMPIAVLLMRAVPRIPTRKFPLGVGRFFILLIICMPIMYLGSLIGSMLSAALSGGTADNPIQELATNADPLTVLVFMVLVAPVFEEWVFRKELIDRLRRYGEVPAMLVSAAAFGLFHLNLFQFFYAFGLGLVFAYVYLRTSRLRYTILMHMIINFNGGFLAPRILSLLDAKTLQALESGSLQESERLLAQAAPGLLAVGLYGLAILALIIVGIVLLITMRRRIVWYRTPEELPRGTRLRIVLGNPGIIGYVVLCLAVTAVTMGVIGLRG